MSAAKVKVKRKAKAPSRVAPKPEAAGPRGRGRPTVHNETWTKATVVLMERQIVWLDRLCADIRANTGKATRRAEIIRALLDGLEKSGLDVTEAKSEEDLTNLVAAKLKR